MSMERLEIQISDNAEQTSGGIDRLAASLNRLRSATANSAGLNKVSNALRGIAEAANSSGFSTLTKKVDTIVSALKPLENLGKNNLTSFVTQLNKIPDVTKKLDVVTTTAFAKAIEKVAIAVKPLATEMEKIAMGFSALPSKMQKFIQQADKSASSATKASTGYKSMASSLQMLNTKFNLTALYFGLRRAASILGDFVENANQYIEDMNLFTVSMGEYADAAYEYAQRAQSLMGINAGEFMRNQGYFMSIASGFGVASDSAAIMSQNLAQLGYDLASFYNSDINTAMTKLQSGLAGELEPLRRWGFALDQVTLQEVALNHGINMNIRDMSQAQKSMIRYIAIMEQSANAQHDMARTLETPANAMRILSQQITLLGRSVGNLLIPILSKIIPYAIAAAKVLRMVADAIAALFGVTLPSIDYDSFGGMSVGIDDSAAGAGDLEDNLSGAAKEAKKIHDYVMGFDELNIIKEPEDVSDGGGGGGSGISGGGGGFDGLDLPQYDFLEGLSEQSDKLVDKMKTVLAVLAGIAAGIALIKGIVSGLKFAKLLSDLGISLGSLLKTIGGIALAVAGAIVYVIGFVDAWKNGVDWKNLAMMIGGVAAAVGGLTLAFSPAIGGIAAVVGGIGLIVVGIKDIITNGKSLQNTFAVVGGILFAAAGIALMIGSWIPLVVGAIVAAIAAVVIWWDEIKAALSTFGAWVYDNVISPIADFFVGLWEGVKGVWDNITSFFSGVFDVIAAPFIAAWEAIYSVWEAVAGWFDTNIFAPISYLFSEIKRVITEFFTQAWDNIVAVWSYAVNWFNYYIIAPITELFSTIATAIGNFFSNAWNAVVKVWGAVTNWFTVNIITPITNLFTSIKEMIVEVFTTAWEGIKRIWTNVATWFDTHVIQPIISFFRAMGDAISAVFKGAVNVVIDAINFFIRGLNHLSFELPAFPGQEAITIGFNIAEIPRLASGGLVGAGQTFIARENGPELVGTFGSKSAVMNNDQIVEAVASGVYEAVSAATNNQSGTNQPIVIQLDGRTIYESNIRQEQSYGYAGFRRTAVSMG